MKTSDFDFQLPEELIAQTPLERRDGSRLMLLDRETGETQHRHFYELPQFLRPGDCLVLNDSRVLPARLIGHREPGGGAAEVLLLIDRGEKVWECLVRPGRRLKAGTRLSFGDGALTAQVLEVCENGNRLVRFSYAGIFLEVLERLGRSNPAAKGALTGSDAYQAGKRILIASQNPVFREMMKSNEYTRDSIKKAIMEVTGVRYGIGPYNGPAPAVQEAPKAAPVEDILQRAQEAGVPVDIR